MTKGRITAVKRFEIHDGDGIRTTVFFKGCPLRCRWCHNPETLSPKLEPLLYPEKCIGCGICANVCPCHIWENGVHRIDRAKCIGCGKCWEHCPGQALVSGGRWVTPEQLLPELLEDRMFYEASGGGVTLSGGEPLAQPEFASDLLGLLKENGIATAVDTSCYGSRQSLMALAEHTDLFLVDIKALDAAVHRRCTGVDNGLILENIRFLEELGKPMDIRVPVIPGWNDDQMAGIADFAATLHCVRTVKLLPYHDYGGAKAKALDIPVEAITPPSPQEMEALRQVFAGRGLSLGE